MSEKLYTIPVNEAFDSDCECPVCKMRQELEQAAIEFTLGPSYMEDDIRMVTNQVGFCERHAKNLYHHQNRLGLALILKTHMDYYINEEEKLAGKRTPAAGLFKKKPDSRVTEYLKKLDTSCYICDRIERLFSRYLATVFYLFENDTAFREKLSRCKGFCNRHFALLMSESETELSGGKREEFQAELTKLHIENLKRVRDDLSWFIDKFDYRNAEAPWKNSQDAVQRALLKTNSAEVEQKTKK